MEKQLRIYKSVGFWICELWIESSSTVNEGYFYEDSVKADNYQSLQIEIGNKKWIDLLNK